MGVDLGEVPKKPCNIEELRGKKFAVDAFNTIYQFLSSIRQPDGMPLQDSSGNITAHLAGIFYRNCRLLENGIRVIYVFDGKPPEFKSDELKSRMQRKIEAEEEWRSALERGDLERAKKAAQATSRLTEKMVDESKELLNLMGIPVVDAPSEGEAQASWMAKEGSVDAVASQDMDCLLFGTPSLLRNLSIGGRRKIPGKNEYADVEPELIELSSVLAQLNITKEQLVWMGLLIGTDFNSGIKGIGPKKAHKIVKESATLAQALKKAGAEGEAEIFYAIEAFFLNPPVKEKIQVRFGEMKTDEIVEFLCQRHDFSYERITKAINSAQKGMRETRSQTRLDEWF